MRNGEPVSTAATLAAMSEPPDWTVVEERNTTLVCMCTDAALDKPACTRVARMASGGVARAVDPVFSSVDGDVAFCLAAGRPSGPPDRFTAIDRDPGRDRHGRRDPGLGIRSRRAVGWRDMALDEFLLRRFEQPDEVRSSARAVRAGRGRRHDAGPGDLRTRLEMGEHVGSSPDDRCQVEHLGIVISGRAAVSGPGYEAVMGPGDIFAVPPDHDSWVVGDEPLRLAAPPRRVELRGRVARRRDVRRSRHAAARAGQV